MFPEPTELLLICHLIESIWIPQSKSNTSTPKTNSQTYWPRETSYVMNGIIFHVCLTLAISVLQIVLKWCRKERKQIQVKKESQQIRSRWWNWSRDAAEGLLMCCLLLHPKARGKPDMKVNFLWARELSSITEQGDLLKTLTHQATQNGMLIKLGLPKSGNLMNELMEDRTGRPVVFAQHTDRFIVENDNMDSYTEAESEMSFKSRSFLHSVNDQVRKRLDQSSKDATKDRDKHSLTWRMFMCSTLEASVFMGKNYSDNLHSIQNTRENLTLKQMFEISEQLILEQSDEIFGVSQINWEDSSWKHLSLIGDEQVISLSHAKVYVFSDSALCFGKMNENPQSNIAWEDRLTWFKSSPKTELWTELMVNQWNSSGISSKDSPHCSSNTKSKSYCQDCNTRKIYWTDYLHVDVQRYLMGIWRQQKRMRVKCSTRLSLCKENWSRTMVIPRNWTREKVVLF